MLIFLDTEYTDPIQIDLISIGMVSEDGRAEFYAERNDYRTEDCNSFVKAIIGTIPPRCDFQAGIDPATTARWIDTERQVERMQELICCNIATLEKNISQASAGDFLRANYPPNSLPTKEFFYFKNWRCKL